MFFFLHPRWFLYQENGEQCEFLGPRRVPCPPAGVDSIRIQESQRVGGLEATERGILGGTSLHDDYSGGFKYSFMFTSIWGRFPLLLLFFQMS